jgi:hypothetical protein
LNSALPGNRQEVVDECSDVSQIVRDAKQLVMPGLDPGIHASAMGGALRDKDVDGRDKPGHDDNVNHVFESEH